MAPFTARWTTADPLAVAQRPISPYAYCFDNPLVVVDRDGQIGETLWDLVNVVMDTKSLVSNIREGKTGAALVDAGGLIAVDGLDGRAGRGLALGYDLLVEGVVGGREDAQGPRQEIILRVPHAKLLKNHYA